MDAIAHTSRRSRDQVVRAEEKPGQGPDRSATIAVLVITTDCAKSEVEGASLGKADDAGSGRLWLCGVVGSRKGGKTPGACLPSLPTPL